MNNNTPMEIFWLNESEKETFSNKGLNSFEKFWNLEKSGADIEYKNIRTHLDRKSGAPSRQCVCIKLNNIKYYLKKASGTAVKSLKNEFDALEIIPKFGFETAKLLAYSFDNESQRGFLLYRNLAGYFCLDDIIQRRLPPDIVASYKIKAQKILARAAKYVVRYQNKNYFYPDLKAKHIFVSLEDKKIAIIDLERFIHDSQKSFWKRTELFRYMAHRKEIKTLLKTLKMKPSLANFARLYLKKEK